MKTGTIMKKLCIVLLALGCSTQLFAQDANVLIQHVSLSPNPLVVGQTGLLTVKMKNVGSAAITRGCALVTIDVPSSISGAILTIDKKLSDPIWTLNNYGEAGNIVLINSKGSFAGGAANHPIVLNISGDAKGGPLTIQATMSVKMGCTALGKIKPVPLNAPEKSTTTLQISVL
jgi:hypothetical protein